ncbi:MAG: hypothetical protein DRG76_07715 [Deltaproteobacteria bacterium]|nr:MAG: hypothetical protein DRG76_07715 [Deltaproteobacteria bacterium]
MNTKGSSNSRYTTSVPAVEQACKILICLSKGGGSPMNLTNICKEVGIHNSKGYSILMTLKRFGLVERDPVSKTYSLGVGLAHLGRRALEGIDLKDIATPYLTELARKTGETALFGILNAEQLFVIAKQEGTHRIGVNIGLGHRFHMTAGAHGKAIVAFMSPAEQKRVLGRKKLYFYGDPSRLDMERLRSDLALCRKRGFAEDAGDLQPGVNAVSSPVFGADSAIVGCIILIGTYPIDRMKEFGPLVADTAKRVSEDLGGDMDNTFVGGLGL